MVLSDNLSNFLSILQCCHKLKLWEYDTSSEYRLLSDHSTDDELLDCFFRFGYGLNTVRDCIFHYKNILPLIISNSYGITWSVCFSIKDRVPKHFYLLGPVFTSDHLQSKVLRYYASHTNPEDIFRELKNTLSEIPVVPMHELINYTIMTHYIITGEKISSDCVSFYEDSEFDQVAFLSPANGKNHFGPDQKPNQPLIDAIRTGNTEYIFVPDDLLSGSSGSEDLDTLQIAKCNAIMLAEVCSTAAISGDYPASFSQELRDHYAHKIMNCTDLSSISLLCQVMVADYAKHVKKYRSDTNATRSIHFCCDYIHTHITDPLSLSSLAELCGYTEYYFSRKFKKEVGLTPSEFINQSKIMRAKLLLKNTTASIEEISQQLRFSSRSYFSAVFLDIAGVSPSTYRKNSRNT